MTYRVVCVLKEGREYNAGRISTLADSLQATNPGARLTCLTDCAVKHPIVDPIPLPVAWPGWWSKMNLFRPGLLVGPTLYLDIDTIVTGPLPDLDFSRFTMLPNVYKPGDFGSGAMAWNGDYSRLHKAFAADPDRWMAEYTTSKKWGDQGFIRDHLGDIPAVFGVHFRSYKAHCRAGVPHGTKVVYFHGKPRPWDVRLRMKSS